MPLDGISAYGVQFALKQEDSQARTIACELQDCGGGAEVQIKYRLGGHYMTGLFLCRECADYYEVKVGD